MQRYRSLRVEPTEEAESAVYPPTSYDSPAEYSFGQVSGQAIPLEEYDFGAYNR